MDDSVHQDLGYGSAQEHDLNVQTFAEIKRKAQEKSKRQPSVYMQLKKHMTEFLKKEFRGEFPQDTSILTQREWRKRGYEYARDAIMVVTFEGPLYDRINYDDTELQTRLWDSLKEFNPSYWYEFGDYWYFAVFPE